MKIIITALFSLLFLGNSFAIYPAKTINPDSNYEEINGKKKQRPSRNSPKAEKEEEEFIQKDDTFVG